MVKKLFSTLILPILFLFIGNASFAKAYDLDFNGGFVADQANVLTDAQESNLNALSKELESKTSAELAVVTLKSLNGKDIADAGLNIGRDYGIGKKDKNNGLILIVAPTDRKLRIEVGYGLEGVIPDSAAGRIRDQYMTQNFKQGKWYDGLYNASQAVAYSIAKDQKVELGTVSTSVKTSENDAESTALTPEQEKAFKTILIIILIVFVVLFILGLIFGDGSGGGGYGGGYSSGGGDSGGCSFGGGSFGGGGCSGGF